MSNSAIKVSKMTGKMEDIPAINTNTLTNEFCKKMRKKDTICKNCYSFSMLETFRSNCVDSWESNGRILSDSKLPNCVLPRMNAAFVRFSAHGELINNFHLINLFAICKKNPYTRFALWTKRKDIVRQVISDGYEIPNNLVMVYSNHRVNDIQISPPKNFDIIFNVVENIDDERINCGTKKCIDCLACYTKSETVIVEALK